MKRLRVGKSQVQRKFKYFSGSWAWDVPVPTIAITIGNRFISGLRIMHHFLTLMNIKFVHISAFLISAYLNMYALLIYICYIYTRFSNMKCLATHESWFQSKPESKILKDHKGPSEVIHMYPFRYKIMVFFSKSKSFELIWVIQWYKNARWTTCIYLGYLVD